MEEGRERDPCPHGDEFDTVARSAPVCGDQRSRRSISLTLRSNGTGGLHISSLEDDDPRPPPLELYADGDPGTYFLLPSCQRPAQRLTRVCVSDKIEEEDGGTSRTLLQKIKPYMGHIQYLKIVLHTFMELNRRLACIILDEMAQKSRRLQGLQIMCFGKRPFFYSGRDILHSLRWLFQGMDEATMQHVDFRHMPFALDNGLMLLVGKCSPNLRTFLINNFKPGLTMLRTETIVEVLSFCPKLSTLGVPYVVLSRSMFQELLRPNREPFTFLDLFYDGLDNDVHEDCWTSVRESHPGFRVGLEFAPIVTVPTMTQALKPYLPISQLCFHSFTHLAPLLTLVAKLYAGTLERLVLHSYPSLELNLALIQLAKACSHLKEIHCFCVVGQGVVEAFQRHCPHLKRYTLSPKMFFPDNPLTVVQ